MARDDLFRRSFEAGTAFLDMTRDRAEVLVKELVKAGEVRKGKAQKLIDEVVERSRKSTEDFRQLIRREIADQVAALGLATKDDIARVEARLDDATASVGAPSPQPRPSKAPPVKRAGATTAKAAKSVKKAASPAKQAAAAGKPATATAATGKPAATTAGKPATATTGTPAATTAPAGDGPGEPPVQGDGDAGGPPPSG